MKKSLKQFVVALMVCLIMSVAALAEKKNEKVSFSRDMVVNGTAVKKGTYKVAIDEQSNELSLINGKDVVAKMKYRKENRSYKSSQPVVTFKQKDNNVELSTITFAGETETFVIGEGANQNATPQQ
jgi:type II secretory pathway component PulC